MADEDQRRDRRPVRRQRAAGADRHRGGDRVTRTAKTRRVEVDRLVKHPKYGKFVKQRTVCYTHDAKPTTATLATRSRFGSAGR